MTQACKHFSYQITALPERAGMPGSTSLELLCAVSLDGALL